jgi:hypothetical protein
MKGQLGLVACIEVKERFMILISMKEKKNCRDIKNCKVILIS